MHVEALNHMERCYNTHVSNMEKGTVLEIGSLQEKPKYREIWEKHGWQYKGADIEAGNNVDIVLHDPWDIPVETNTIDAIISGSMLEHNEYFWLSFLEMSRVLKPDGVMIHIAPSRGIQHRAPQDCWRFYRDSMFALAKWSGLECTEATTDWPEEHFDIAKNRPALTKRLKDTMVFDNSNWGDTVGVFRKIKDTSQSEGAGYLRKIGAKLAVA